MNINKLVIAKSHYISPIEVLNKQFKEDTKKAKDNNDYHLAKQLLYRTNEKYLEPNE
jgi:hypothetical protein